MLNMWDIDISINHAIYLKFFYESESESHSVLLTLCDPMDSIVHGILQDRILEWVAFPFSRGSSQPRDRTQVSHMAGKFFTSWATKETQEYWRR